MFLPMLTINAFEAGYDNRLSLSGFDMAGGIAPTKNTFKENEKQE